MHKLQTQLEVMELEYDGDTRQRPRNPVAPYSIVKEIRHAHYKTQDIGYIIRLL